jgi:predicted short-subunit dehydrogenase-like oxidoreductase (DUF2520 family)
VACDYPVRAVLSRTPASAAALAEQVGATTASDDPEALPDAVRLVLICVPDDALTAVAEELAAVDHSWPETVVAHTSGLYTADALAPLADRGATAFSFHPLQTFAPDTAPDAFNGIGIGIDGTDDAVAIGTRLARDLGARPAVLSPKDKARYHCAAALASNGLVALMAVVQDVLPDAARGEAADDAASLMAPLVEQTWSNLKAAPPESVLTGPVARGDHDTVAAHLEALEEATPHLLPLYAALSTEMTRLAVRGGQLDADTAEALLRRLRTPLQPPPDESGGIPPSH